MMIYGRVNIEAHFIRVLDLPHDLPGHVVKGFAGSRLNFRVNSKSHGRSVPFLARFENQAEEAGRKEVRPGAEAASLTLRLEAQLGCKLKLPRIQHGAGRPVQRIRRALLEELRRTETSRSIRIAVAEVSGAVVGIEITDVHSIGDVKSLHEQFKFEPLADGERASQANVERCQPIAPESIPRLDSDAVIVAKDVAVHVEPGEFREEQRRLQGQDGAEGEIAHKEIPRVRRVERRISYEAMPNVVRGIRAFFSQVVAVLRNQHE